MSNTGYSKAQIAIHWLIAILVIIQLVLHEGIGNLATHLKDGVEPNTAVLLLGRSHVVLGLVIFGLAIFRVFVRLKQGAPLPPETENPILVVIAKLTKLILYSVLILMPISGSAAWFLGQEAALKGHLVGKFLLVGFLVLHILGALYQHFILKTDVLKRMVRREQ